MFRRLLGVVIAAGVASSACDGFIRPPDPLEVDPDVVSVAIMLMAGETEARMLAAHPHRKSGEAAPTVTATLKGPGWTAAFSDTLSLEECTRAGRWLGPAKCLRAALPEEIQGGEGYEIEGTAPMGVFSGEAVLPVAPLLREPGDSLYLTMPSDYEGHLIPMLYQSGSDIGTLLAEAVDAFAMEEDGTETEVDGSSVGFFPRALEGAEADTAEIYYRETPVRFSLRLLGIGWNYTNFVDNEGIFPLPKPWPSFGIEGEGVYGYFDGAVPSRVTRVWVK